MSTRILIVDDHGLIRAGLRALLDSEEDIEVVGDAGDGNTAVQLANELKPDIVLMDISMPEMNGIEATGKIKEILPQTQVLAMTVHEDESMLREMVRAGASGYIIKRAMKAELLRAIQLVLQGNLYIYPSLTRALFMNGIKPEVEKPNHRDALTPREKEVLYLLARGYTNHQIARELSISTRTVEGHRSSLTSKLGFSSRMELVNYAEANGLLERD
jgi:two-component system, NarL family, response regulator NreC